MAFPEESVRELAAVAAGALAHRDLSDALNEICRSAVRAVPNADGSSLTSFTENGANAVASSDEWSKGLDEMQYVEREGPCYDAARSGVIFRIRDTTSEPRWPFYMPRAADSGVLSMLSLPLTIESKTTGALNVYSKQPDAFDSQAVSIAEIIAAHVNLASRVAATLFGHKELADQLREAMASRSVIEQAKGVIMATTGGDPDSAFDVLRQQSQHENRKLREIAEEIVSRYRTK